MGENEPSAANAHPLSQIGGGGLFYFVTNEPSTAPMSSLMSHCLRGGLVFFFLFFFLSFILNFIHYIVHIPVKTGL